MFPHGLKQVIESFTRITEKTTTLIDPYILTNSVENISQRGVLEISMSDHYAIFCTRKTQKQKYHKHKFIAEKLNVLVFPDYSKYHNVDVAYSDFTDKLTKVINEIASFKNMCKKQYQ